MPHPLLPKDDNKHLSQEQHQNAWNNVNGMKHQSLATSGISSSIITVMMREAAFLS